MFKFFIKLLKASLLNNLLLSILSIIGLAIGICSSLLLYLWIADELSFDRFHENAENIYRIISVESVASGEKKSVYTPKIMAQELENSFPQIEKAATYVKHFPPMPVIYNDKIIRFYFSSVSYDFFDIFDFPIIYQAYDTILINENSAVISRECAEKLFGKEYPIGKTIEKFFNESTRYIVRAVVDIPENSHLQFDIVIPFCQPNFISSYKTPWEGPRGVNYIRFVENVNFDEHQQLLLENFLAEKSGTSAKLIYQPVTDIHLHTDFHDQNVNNNGDIRYVRTFTIASILMLIISGINYIILTIARSEKRNRETALKKIFGLNKSMIIGQFMAETLVVTVIAQLIALVLFLTIQPWFNQFTGKSLGIFVSSQTVLFFMLSACIITLLAGAYHSFRLSSFKLVDLLKGTSKNGEKYNLSTFITPFQLVFSLIFILCSISIYNQLKYMQSKDKGICLKNVIAVNALGFKYDYEAIKNELLKNTSIYSVTASAKPPIDWHNQYDKINWEGKNNDEKYVFSTYCTDASFLETFDIKLLNGSFLPPDLTEKDFFDNKYLNNAPIVINESARSVLGYEDPIGKKIDFGYDLFDGYIIGVVEDFHFKPLNHNISPLIILYRPEVFWEIYMKINPENKQEIVAYIEKVTEPYREGKYPFDYCFLEDKINSLYKAEKNMSGFAFLFAFISVSLAVMGMIGMISYLVKRQRKSIAIRKVFGAETHDIIFLYVKQVLKLTGIASLVAGVVAWYYLEHWLQSYAYHIKLSPIMFAQVFITAVVAISILTIALVYTEAKKNPVDNLKYE